MNPERLLQHFDRISEAPDAIPRLRRFILDLAVRGKLVEQDPNDEPAVELLKRIQTEKVRLLKAGSARKEKSATPLVADELPFSLPKNWQWSQLAEIGFINPRNEADSSMLASFVPMTLIASEYGVPHKHEVKQWGEFKTGYTHFAEGDVGLAKITPCFENGKSTVFRGLTGGFGAGTTELHIVRPILANADYILLFLKSPYFIETGIPRMTGTAGQKRVSSDYFAYSPFPLPPLAEQHRIVAKVDELMALCDHLQAAQSEREQHRDRLVVASLNKLNQSEQSRRPGRDCRDPDFRDESNAKPTTTAAILAKQPAEISEASPAYLPVNWIPAIPAGTTGFDDVCFVLENLPRLTTRPAHIKQLRQTILNLAVRGKLVPQDPNDEPAVELLKRIQEEKLLQRPRSQSDKGKKTLELLDSDSIAPFGWRMVDFSDYALEISTGPFGSALHQSEYVLDGIPLVNPSHMVNGRIQPDRKVTVSADTANRLASYRMKAGDIVMARRGEVGRAALVTEIENGWLCGTGSFFLRFHSEVFREYILLLLQSQSVRKFLAGEAVGITMGNLNHGILKRMPLAIPPLAEQHRIVAKVDKLMALCDQLETQLTSTATDSRRLLEAVLHEALLPASEQEA